MIITYITILLTGMVVGLLSTVFGVGGGIIMVPVLSLILPYSHVEAVATSLATIFLVVSVNTYFFNKKKLVVWRIVFWIAITSGVCSLLAAWAATMVPEKILIGLFICILFWIAIQTFLIRAENEPLPWNKTRKIIPLLIGILSGTIAGPTGVGGGAITTPLMLKTGLVAPVQAPPTSNEPAIATPNVSNGVPNRPGSVVARTLLVSRPSSFTSRPESVWTMMKYSPSATPDVSADK